MRSNPPARTEINMTQGAFNVATTEFDVTCGPARDTAQAEPSLVPIASTASARRAPTMAV